jgi:lysophospholipase L1-like esterase
MKSRPALRSIARLRLAVSTPIFALLISLLAAACAGGPTGLKPVTRIMPLGDSITDGYQIPGGYRIDLWRELGNSGIAVDFVGSLRNGPSSLGDKGHEGHTGWRIDQLRASVNGWIETYRPDVVLLLIGTNDVLQHYRVTTAPNRLGALVDQIYSRRPTTKVFLSTIPPTLDAAANVQIAAFNAAARQVVRTRAAAHRPIWLVDGGNLSAADIADGVHPNAAGYGKIAHAWYVALVKVLIKPSG